MDPDPQRGVCAISQGAPYMTLAGRGRSRALSQVPCFSYRPHKIPQACGVLRVRQEPLEQGLGPPSGGLWGCDQLKPLRMVTKCLHILLSLSLGARCLSPDSVSPLLLLFLSSTFPENAKRPNYLSHMALTKPALAKALSRGTKQTQGTVIMDGKGIQYYGMSPGRCQGSVLAVSPRRMSR